MGILEIEGPDYKLQAINSSLMSRRGVVEAILYDESFGLATIEADFSYVRYFFAQIKEARKVI